MLEVMNQPRITGYIGDAALSLHNNRPNIYTGRLPEHDETPPSSWRRMYQMQCHLLELPDELIVCIVDCLNDDPQALRGLATVDAQFQALAEERLYRNIFFRKDDELQRLHAAFIKRPSRAKAVRSIDLRCQLDDGEYNLFFCRGKVSHTSTNFELMSDVLHKARNIQELTMESPYCNVLDGEPMWEFTNDDTWGRTMRAWFRPFTAAVWPATRETAQPLRWLKRLTLHLNGVRQEFWTAESPFAYVFLMQQLEYLHLSSVNITSMLPAQLPSLKTSLKELKLDEANVDLKGLRCILAMPRALEHLYLGENVNSRDTEDYPAGQTYNRLIDRSPDEFLDVLAQQASSLKTLTYIPGITPRDFDHREDIRVFGAGLHNFVKLEEATMHSYLSLSSVQQLFFRSQDLAPPNLRSLHIKSGFDDLVLDMDPSDSRQLLPIQCLALQALTTMPSLKTLDFTVDRVRLVQPWSIGPRLDEMGRALKSVGNALKEREIRFEVFQQGPRGRYVAPLLYGETVRPDEVVYSNMDNPSHFQMNVYNGGIAGSLTHDFDLIDSESGSESESESEWETASESDEEEADGSEELGVMDGLQE